MKTVYNAETAEQMNEEELIIALEEMAQSLEILELELLNRGTFPRWRITKVSN